MSIFLKSSCFGRKIIKSFLLLSVFWAFAFVSIGSCQEVYQITDNQLIALENNLIHLQKNNSELKTLLKQSNQELMIASNKSETLNNQIQTLEKQLIQSETQIQTLTQQLQMLKIQSEKASNSLQTANEELQKVSQSFKQCEEQQNKLKKQKLLWQIIAGVIATYAISK
nr:MAG TPA: SECRETED 45 KDA PROTEIN CYCLE, PEPTIDOGLYCAN, CHAP, CELL [Caudoviricetes sp.]